MIFPCAFSLYRACTHILATKWSTNVKRSVLLLCFRIQQYFQENVWSVWVSVIIINIFSILVIYCKHCIIKLKKNSPFKFEKKVNISYIDKLKVICKENTYTTGFNTNKNHNITAYYKLQYYIFLSRAPYNSFLIFLNIIFTIFDWLVENFTHRKKITFNPKKYIIIKYKYLVGRCLRIFLWEREQSKDN